MSRPLVYDLLPATHGALIGNVALRDGTRYPDGAYLGADGAWHVLYHPYLGPLDPGRFARFTVTVDDVTTEYRRFSDRRWLAAIRRAARPRHADPHTGKATRHD